MGELRKAKRGKAGGDRLIIALSGLPGTGKTTLAHALVERLSGAYLGFGDHVRALAKERGRASDRPSLQDLGEALVRDDPAGFVADALSRAPHSWKILVVDGVRHLSILDALRNYAHQNDASLQLIHLTVDIPDRIDRMVARGIDPSAARMAEGHASERDVSQRLADTANIHLDASQPIEQLIVAVLGAASEFSVCPV
jgi:adenylate kinase family enzyme